MPSDDAQAASAPITKRRRAVPSPVRYDPPQVPVWAVGLLLRGRVTGRDLAATVTDLQHRGHLEIDVSGQHESYLVRRRSCHGDIDAPEQTLLDSLSSETSGGDWLDLSDRDTLAAIAADFGATAMRRARSQDWFEALPQPREGLSWKVLTFVGVAIAAAELLLMQLPPLVGSWLILCGVIGWLLGFRFRRGSRSALGSALVDQIEGFRTYLATAEEDELRFDAHHDVYARYLSWAVSFDVADRWRRVNRQALSRGTLPDFRLPPTWMLDAIMRSGPGD